MQISMKFIYIFTLFQFIYYFYIISVCLFDLKLIMFQSMQIGPIFLPARLNGENYLELIRDELPGILFPDDQVDDMPLIRRRILFMHDGCPAHFAGKNLFKVFKVIKSLINVCSYQSSAIRYEALRLRVAASRAESDMHGALDVKFF